MMNNTQYNVFELLNRVHSIYTKRDYNSFRQSDFIRYGFYTHNNTIRTEYVYGYNYSIQYLYDGVVVLYWSAHLFGHLLLTPTALLISCSLHVCIVHHTQQKPTLHTHTHLTNTNIMYNICMDLFCPNIIYICECIRYIIVYENVYTSLEREPLLLASGSEPT